MSTFIFSFAASQTADDQLLAKAARVALEADSTPRMVKIMVDHDGTPIEIPEGEPLSKSSEE